MSTLLDGVEALVCDLDGVVYRGPAPVPHAVEALRSLGLPVVYATNNASRTPAAVAGHLRSLGLPCDPDDVVTSSQAAAWLLRDEVAPGSRVLAVGGEGVRVAVEEAGFELVRPGDRTGGAVDAVVQGYGPAVTASDLAEAAYAIEAGARWVATNTDATLPTDRGVAPGNGSLVAAVARAVGHLPHVVAGKPEPPLYLLAADRVGVDPSRVLAVGDRLDTDVAGALRAGSVALLVLTGVDDIDAVLAAPHGLRPSWVVTDLRALAREVDEGAPSAESLRSAVRRHWAALDGGDDGERTGSAVRALLSAAAAE